VPPSRGIGGSSIRGRSAMSSFLSLHIRCSDEEIPECVQLSKANGSDIIG